jgi:hypothetical protein
VEIVIIPSTMNDLSYYECMKVVTKLLGIHHRVGTNEEKTTPANRCSNNHLLNMKKEKEPEPFQL